jgi:hypothetical protein
MFTEGFGLVEDQDITQEELEAKLAEAPAPVARLIRAFQANNEAVTNVAEAIGESGDVRLMYTGMGLMLASGELEDAFGDFLSFLLERADKAITSLTGDAAA